MADEKCLQHKQIQAHIINIYILVNRYKYNRYCIWAIYFIYFWMSVSLYDNWVSGADLKFVRDWWTIGQPAEADRSALFPFRERMR